jgi:hypothetical protein
VLLHLLQQLLGNLLLFCQIMSNFAACGVVMDHLQRLEQSEDAAILVAGPSRGRMTSYLTGNTRVLSMIIAWVLNMPAAVILPILNAQEFTSSTCDPDGLVLTPKQRLHAAVRKIKLRRAEFHAIHDSPDIKAVSYIHIFLLGDDSFPSPKPATYRPTDPQETEIVGLCWNCVVARDLHMDEHPLLLCVQASGGRGVVLAVIRHHRPDCFYFGTGFLFRFPVEREEPYQVRSMIALGAWSNIGSLFAQCCVDREKTNRE